MKRKYVLILAVMGAVLNASVCVADSASSGINGKKAAVKEMSTITNEAEYAEWVRKNERASHASSANSPPLGKSSASSKASTK